MDDGARETVQVALDRNLVDNAEAAGVDVRRVMEETLRRHTREARRAAMTQEEREKIRSQIGREIEIFNEHVDKHGLLSDSFRSF